MRFVPCADYADGSGLCPPRGLLRLDFYSTGLIRCIMAESRWRSIGAKATVPGLRLGWNAYAYSLR